MFATGIKDDIIGLDPVKKFMAQFVATLIIAYFGNLRIVSLHGFLGLETLPYWVSMGLTITGTMFVTNAFNLIDGIEGLAGGLGMLICSFSGCSNSSEY